MNLAMFDEKQVITLPGKSTRKIYA